MRHLRLSGLIVCAVALTLASSLSADTPHGLWLLPRKDSCNTARADVAGDMKTAPHEMWSYGCAPDNYSYLRPVRANGKQAYLAQVRSGLRLVHPDGTIAWNRPTMGVSTVVDIISQGSRQAALVTMGTDRFALVDVATGRMTWTWTQPIASYVGGYQVLRDHGRTLLIVFPQNSMIGFCFDIGRAVPKLIWERNYTGRYWVGYGPFFSLADMDNDGTPEIVLIGKPGYAGVIDLRTGAVKFDLQYDIIGEEHAGRPYGLITATDLDGDGYLDIVVVSCQVEQYISVLRNNGGKGLSLAWSRFVARDYPVETVKLRPNTTSVADVNGDGKQELVLGLFNETGDQRWHTIVFDTMKGYNARIADLPDRCFWACRDLDADGVPEIVTSIEKKDTPEITGFQAVDGKTFADTATVDSATLGSAHTSLPLDTIFHANLTEVPYLTSAGGRTGLLVSRDGKDLLWRIEGGKSVLDPVSMTPLSRVVLSSEGTGKIGRTDLTLGAPKVITPSASGPLVAQANGKRELILSLSDGTISGGTPDFSKPGRFLRSWSVPGSMPSAWTGPKGERFLCAVGPTADSVSIYQPDQGKSEPISTITTPVPVSRVGVSRSTEGLMPFGKGAMKLFVGLRPGIHAIAGALYDAAGNTIWYDKENGPYPRIAAATDLNGDGDEEIITDNHGRHTIYDSKGSPRTVAVGWSGEVPGRADGAKYAVPVVGPFGPKGATRILMAGGLDALESLDANGSRLARHPFPSTYEFQWCGAAVAKMRSTGEWDVGTANTSGIFYCSDAITCETRWTLTLRAKPATGINISSGDVDGDGRDNFLVGLPNGDLLALDERNGKGFVLWKVTFDAGVKEAIMADVDADGKAEILVDLDDGRVKVLKR